MMIIHDTSSELSQLIQTKLISVYTPFPYEPWGPKNAEEAKSYKFQVQIGTVLRVKNPDVRSLLTEVYWTLAMRSFSTP